MPKLFNKTLWGLSSVFWGLFLAITIAGGSIANSYETQINSFLDINPFIQVDDSDNTTPDVMYYKSDYNRYRWHKNEDGKYEFQLEWNVDGLHDYAKAAIKQVNNEGSVILWNNDETLPLKQDSNISLYGTSVVASNYIVSGEGSGAHAANTQDTLRLCLESNGVNVNPSLTDEIELKAAAGYKSTMHNLPGSDINVVYFDVNELPFSMIQATSDSTIASYGDTAIYIISRNGSENGDLFFNASECLDGNYLDLTNEEVTYLNQLESYKEQGLLDKIVLVLNTSNPMQFKNLVNYDIDACLWVGFGGTSSFRSLADVLTGRADPNGRLPNIYVYDNYSAPATVNQGDFTFSEYSDDLPATTTYTHNTKYIVYQEGIYVGYRYYETRYEDYVLNQGLADSSAGAKESVGNWRYDEEVIFPFGYGSSYAEFERSNYRVEFDVLTNSYNCYLTTKNVSDTYSGKDVFQVYLQKAYTDYDKQNKIEKSAVELIGFAKSPKLAPGEEYTFEVNVKVSDFISYDSYKAKTYILEKGDYYLAYGDNSHDALNNILASKGADTSRMDAPGNASYAYKITQKEDDFETYSKSLVTGNPITNQFDDTDINLYEHTQDQKITYLTRNDWAGTYPTSPVSMKCVDPEMVKDMQITSLSDEIVNSDITEMPVYEQDNGLSLIDLMYEDFDSEKWDLLLNQMTQEEQVAIVTDAFEMIQGATSINAPSAKVQDGPAGIRKAENSMGYSCEVLMAATFNVPLVKKLGTAFGMECMQLGFGGVYGPGANIHRSAYSGRNFEYFSEDPVLSAVILDAELDGLCSKGVIPFTKHFALNDQERNRYGVATWANEQSIREIYLKAFQLSTEKGTTLGLMSSYNRLGCTWTGAHKGLLTNVLRDEWGFIGAIETDCSAGEHMATEEAVANAVVAGQDLWLGSPVKGKSWNYKNLPIVAQALRTSTKRALYAVLHSNVMNGMKSGIKIVEITPWWQSTILGLQIGAGVLTGASLILVTLSFLFPVLKRKEEK